MRFPLRALPSGLERLGFAPPPGRRVTPPARAVGPVALRRTRCAQVEG